MTLVLQKKRVLKAVGTILFVLAACLSSFAQGKNPVILIPGLTGSELLHKETLKKVWFKVIKSKYEDLRLPILADPTKMHDDLVPGDILRRPKVGIFPVTDVYDGFIKAMTTRGGYHEEKWDSPTDKGASDALYVFAYDWRLDNVNNARLLIRRIDELRRKLNRPDLKFDIVAHSMGGIISRYAAMYGDVDLPRTGRLQPTWAGSRYFDKIFLLGTPNEGSTLALSVLQTGFMVGNFKIDLPFIQDVSKYTAFTIPAAFELLPAPGTLKAYDQDLAPVAVDIYDPKVWTRYGWNLTKDPKFAATFTAAERKAAPLYLANVLARSKRLHEALAASNSKTGSVTFYVVGSDCKTSLDSIIVYQDPKDKAWHTIFRPKGFSKPDGQKITDEDVKKIMLKPGDGIVTRRSLGAESSTEKTGAPAFFSRANETYVCEEHTKLAANSQIQDYVIGVLTGKSTPQKEKTTLAASRP